MDRLVTTTPGLYPPPDWAERPRVPAAESPGFRVDAPEAAGYCGRYGRLRRELIGWQRDAGLDRIVEGQARWRDRLAHPLVVHDAVETGGTARYYDGCAYREPVVTGDLSYDGSMAATAAAALATVPVDRFQAVVPGPYTLADLAAGDRHELLAATGSFLAAEIEDFPSIGTLMMLEPGLVSSPPDDGTDARASEAIDGVASATDAPVVVHTYGGAFDEKVHAHLLDADVDAVGYDLVTDHDAALYTVNEYGTADDVALGVVDARGGVPPSATVRERVEWFVERTPVADFGTVYATASTELAGFPAATARAVLSTLGGVDGPHRDRDRDE
jgi:5-methyltetrahydropteroyltriglutamate--homocysteine methyltransferase